MTFDDISKNLGAGNDNMGGLTQKVYFGLWADVATWPTVPATPATLEEASALTGSVLMKSGKRMFEMYITDDTGEFAIELVGEKDGKSFVKRLRFSHPGLQKKILGFLNSVKNENMVFIAEDNDGQKYLMGDSSRPATLETSPDGIGTSMESAGKRATSLEFSYKCKNVYVYEGDIPLTIASV